MNRHNLLIVDDEKDILRTLTLTFEVLRGLLWS